MKKYVLMLAICQAFYAPVVLSAGMFSTSEKIEETSSHSGGLFNNDLTGSNEGSFQNPGNFLTGSQQGLMAPALPGDVGGEMETPVGDSWLAVLILACIYIVIRAYYHHRQLNRNKD